MASDLGEFELAVDCHAGLPCDAMELRLLPSHARHIDAEVEASIEAEWEAKLARHPRLFNGRKFRYGGARVNGGGDGMRLTLELGLTDYRAMVGTNLSPRFGELLGRDPRLLSNALGNGAVVETSDGCVMLLLRSPQMLEAPNTYVFPGGHPEPLSVGLEAWGEAELREHSRQAAGGGAAAGGGDAAAAVAVERRVCDECFASVRREVVEELGCRDEDLCTAPDKPPLLLGISLRNANYRYTMAFVLSCASSSAEIIARYRAGYAEDSFESTRLVALPRASLAERARSLPMPGCHRGVLELYLRHLDARSHAPVEPEGAKL